MKEKWCWIELIGFDKDRPDYAVGEFLQRMGEKPAAISLLFMDLGFVLLHESDRPYTLRPIDCAYGNKDCNEDRMRQAWESKDLVGLIDRLRREGIAVYVSFFNVLGEERIDGVDFTAVREVDREGNAGNLVSMIKRFPDGTSFADVFLPKLREVVRYYGFDGVQFADGTSCARYPVELGDFTDDIVAPFIEKAGLCELSPVCKTPTEYAARRDEILKNYRYPFTQYLSSRWADYYKKIRTQLEGIPLVFNSYWTRDPFEALYRYGIDYRKCLQEGDCLMVEEVSASYAIYAEEDQCEIQRTQEERKGYHQEFYLMQMSLKCCLPTVKQLTLTTIKDTTEQWDIIRQAPMELAKAVYRRNNGYVLEKGEWIPYSNAPLYCLADGVAEENWRFLASLERVRIPLPQAPLGGTLLWAGGRLDEELRQFCEDRRYSSSELYQQLVKNGVTVSAMTSAEGLARLQTPLIVANPDTLTKEEREAVERCAVPILTVGYGRLSAPVSWEYEQEGFVCALYNVDVVAEEGATFLERVKNIRFQREKNLRDEVFGIWVGRLAYNGLPTAFFSALADFVNKALGFPYAADRRCQISGFRRENKLYLLLCNEEYYYVIPEIMLTERIRAVKSLTKIDGYKVQFSGTSFRDRIPPRGMDVVEITVE